MKQVLVTGGTRGIGEGIARSLAKAGWSVVAASVSQTELDSFEPQGGITVRLLNVTDQTSVDAVFSDLTRLDALVNCAGILLRGEEYDIDVFAKVLDVNLTGTMRCCLAAHSLLAERGGAIVNTASMLSTFGGPLVPSLLRFKRRCRSVDEGTGWQVGRGWCAGQRDRSGLD
ncbi:SDR family oxidoreductase [Phaeobacter sp. BS23]|uniref:SDR family NAD(P)-dependent oxidoreductase n=1 Tax=Phaeobacter sp. BS23 TaxID=2907239 RepID=UPI0038709201